MGSFTFQVSECRYVGFRGAGLGGLAVKLRIESWDPVAEEWHRGRDTGCGIWVLGSSALG